MFSSVCLDVFGNKMADFSQQNSRLTERELLKMEDDEDEDSFYQKLLLQAASEEKTHSQSTEYVSVTPKPGFCLKTKSNKEKKVFINICMADNIPEPREISDEELVKLLDSEDPSGYRIPLSLGEPHAELDKSGSGCTAYDVVINRNFYQRIKKQDALMGFFLTVVLEGLENKYDISLDRNWRILKNRPFIGSLPEQNVRSRSKPWIMEMDNSNQSSKPKISEISSASSPVEQHKAKGQEPVYVLMKEPVEGHPDYLVAEVQLPKVKVAAAMTLDVGEDRILLQTRSSAYYLDVFLPYRIIQEECVSQFNRSTHILTITMPIQPRQ